jgi:hypothetical protein
LDQFVVFDHKDHNCIFQYTLLAAALQYGPYEGKWKRPYWFRPYVQK